MVYRAQEPSPWHTERGQAVWAGGVAVAEARWCRARVSCFVSVLNSPFKNKQQKRKRVALCWGQGHCWPQPGPQGPREPGGSHEGSPPAFVSWLSILSGRVVLWWGGVPPVGSQEGSGVGMGPLDPPNCWALDSF